MTGVWVSEAHIYPFIQLFECYITSYITKICCKAFSLTYVTTDWIFLYYMSCKQKTSAPLLCELNFLGRPCGAGWMNKESSITCCVTYIKRDWIVPYITCYIVCYIGINRISILNSDSSTWIEKVQYTLSFWLTSSKKICLGTNKYLPGIPSYACGVLCFLPSCPLHIFRFIIAHIFSVLYKLTFLNKAVPSSHQFTS